MRTLGIHLASAPERTATCAIHWESGMAFVETPEVRADDLELVARMRAADCTAIDAPFGWPDAVVAAIATFADTGTWPSDAVPERLRYRATDWFVHDYIAHEQREAVRPLSVSSDVIAVSAWRCARLLTDFAKATGWKLDRVGLESDGVPATPRVVEAYPAAALAMWGLPFRGYKQTTSLTAADAAEKRALTLRMLSRLARSWLLLSESARGLCVESDSAFDALICSLVACAAATRQTVTPASELRARARREGWIHLPSPTSIDSLGPVS
jgi:predicted nuclease with RNAse H fold